MTTTRTVIARSEATKQSRATEPYAPLDCFAVARNDGVETRHAVVMGSGLFAARSRGMTKAAPEHAHEASTMPASTSQESQTLSSQAKGRSIRLVRLDSETLKSLPASPPTMTWTMVMSPR